MWWHTAPVHLSSRVGKMSEQRERRKVGAGDAVLASNQATQWLKADLDDKISITDLGHWFRITTEVNETAQEIVINVAVTDCEGKQEFERVSHNFDFSELAAAVEDSNHDFVLSRFMPKLHTYAQQIRKEAAEQDTSKAE